jgi:hypothetical protein
MSAKTRQPTHNEHVSIDETGHAVVCDKTLAYCVYMMVINYEAVQYKGGTSKHAKR